MLFGQIILVLCGVTVVAYAEQRDVCKTEVCNQTAGLYLKNMDRSVEPCNDFYGFACGNYLKNVNFTNTKVQHDAFTEMNEVVQQELGKLLNQTCDVNDNNVYKSMKRFYALCKDEVEINARGAKPAVEMFKKAGGWPVLEKHWNEHNWSFIDTEILMTSVSEATLIDVEVGPSLNDPSKLAIWINQPEMFPPRAYLTDGYNNTGVRVYQQLWENLAVGFGADRKTALQEQNETLTFLMSLAKITTKPEDLRDLSKMPHMTLGKLKKRWRWMDWDRLLNGLLPQGMSPLMSTDLVIVKDPCYVTKLEKLLKKFSRR